MKRTLALILTLIMCLATFTACGNDKTGWEYIEDNGKLIVGLDDTFAPMGFRDEEGNLVGFDIDLAKAVGEILNVEVEFQPIDWDSKDMELSSKKIDCIWNGMSATPERQESMSLTNKYLNNKIVVMTIKDDVKVTSAKDLSNYNVGTQAKSAALEVMLKNADAASYKEKIKEYPTYDEAILDMEAGRIDCIVVDQVLGEYKNSKRADNEKLKVCEYNFGDDFYAIGCRKEDSDVAKKINEALAQLIENGKAAEISEKWFGKNIVINEGYDETEESSASENKNDASVAESVDTSVSESADASADESIVESTDASADESVVESTDASADESVVESTDASAAA